MSAEVHITEGFGLIKTESKFVLIIKDEIYGPYRNEHVRVIVEVLERNKGGKVNER